MVFFFGSRERSDLHWAELNQTLTELSVMKEQFVPNFLCAMNDSVFAKDLPIECERLC